MSNNKPLHAVTGAFSYTGKYIAKELLAHGNQVITLTGQPKSANPFSNQVKAFPFNFDNPAALAESLTGVETLYNTYWVRMDYGHTSFDKAIANTRKLLRAAANCRVRRIIHISITNADASSHLPYFHGKGILEDVIKKFGISYTILRPAVIFSAEDILLNNIAWMLRRLPSFGIPGDGEYRVRPIFVEDLAALAVNVGENNSNQIIDAVGPESYTFNQLIKLIHTTVRSRALLVHSPPGIVYLLSKIMGFFLGDVILTREEIHGLMDNLLDSNSPATGTTRFSDWLQVNAKTIGARYANDMKRRS